MIHCTVWCPVGTLTSYLKNINPFRMRIEESAPLYAVHISMQV